MPVVSTQCTAPDPGPGKVSRSTRLLVFLAGWTLLGVHAQTPPDEHVILEFFYTAHDVEDLHLIGGHLDEALTSAGAGKHVDTILQPTHGNTRAIGLMLLSGSDAKEIFRVIFPMLQEFPIMRSAFAVLRYNRGADGGRKTIRMPVEF